MILNEGIVHSGEYAGWKIPIVDDTAGETGGYYLILQHGDIECFDYWFEQKGYLDNQPTDFDIKWNRLMEVSIIYCFIKQKGYPTVNLLTVCIS